MSRQIPEAARRQDGVISAAQCLVSGMTRDRIRAHLDAGRWQRVHRGVFATFSGPVPRPSRLWAAVLAGGKGATLSHHSAATLGGIDVPGDGRIHVSIPLERAVSTRSGIQIHRCRDLDARRHPALLPPRVRVEDAVLDVISEARGPEAALAILTDAIGSRLCSPARFGEALERRPHTPWRRHIMEALSDAQTGSHSLLELIYLRTVERAHRLPTGVRQAHLQNEAQSRWIDVRYSQYGVRVELDGRAGHESTRDRWRDMVRDNDGTLSGDRTLRFGWHDVNGRPCQVATQVGVLLRSSGWVGRLRACRAACTVKS